MKKTVYFLLGILTSLLLSYFINISNGNETEFQLLKSESHIVNQKINKMKLGVFSISLSVKDLAASKVFYEKLGFSQLGGDMKMNYLIMKSDNSIVGLFQGMFENNILTFNPGWDESAQNVPEFNDIRELQKQFKNEGIDIVNEADPKSTGPASFMVTDPDGNVILFDQHR